MSRSYRSSPRKGSSGDADGGGVERVVTSWAWTVFEITLGFLLAIVISTSVYLVANRQAGSSMLDSLTLVCDYGEWGVWSECYADDPKRPLGPDGALLPGVKYRSRPLLKDSTDRRFAFHRCSISDTQTATCSPTEIHGGGVVSVVEDAADKPTALGAVGAARVSTAGAASTGAPLLTPDRGASSWCMVGVWSKWTKCAGCGFVLQRRERSVKGKLCPNSYEARACTSLPDCPTPPPKAAVAGGSSTVAPYITPTYENNLKLNCNNSKDTLIYLDGAPFAKGYAKTAWRALYHGKHVVVKRPIDKAKISRFVKGIKWEDEWFESLNHRYISQYHGVCRDKDNAFEVVEGGLTKWSFVADNKGTPWCLRLRMAMQTVELTLYLLRNAIIHCDWKYDQTAIDFDGNLKLVDVKSLRHLEWTENHERRNYKSGTTCTHGSTCKKCMKMAANLTSEHSCDHASKKCHGYGEKGMTYSTSLLFFRHLFRPEVFRDAPSPQFHKDIATLYKNAEHAAQTHRWTLLQLSDHLQQMHDAYDADTCLRDGDRIRDVVRSAYADMTTGYEKRCKKRYC